MTVKTFLMGQPFSWRLAALGGVCALVVSLPELIYGNDFGAFLIGTCAFAVITVMLHITALVNVRRKVHSVFAMLAAYCLLLWVLHHISSDVRTHCRWVLEGADYKHQVLERPQSPSKGLKHVEWEEWGFVATGDTTVYLVVDPSDDLADEFWEPLT